ncbi:hypothetical protein [Glycomyces artemisiae]|uniref:Uncharacterized protein n=1 Tax=Glycomyces artemisiae TaxID=1076443 RepID=A0A2T0UF68_9ACTN|nr:hypothetical protein [Glycomyces artemisiae]PRY56573.1 hypothetical protein B0I28_109222 [Glycomyces artemisiae]
MRGDGGDRGGVLVVGSGREEGPDGGDAVVDLAVEDFEAPGGGLGEDAPVQRRQVEVGLGLLFDHEELDGRGGGERQAVVAHPGVERGPEPRAPVQLIGFGEEHGDGSRAAGVGGAVQMGAARGGVRGVPREVERGPQPAVAVGALAGKVGADLRVGELHGLLGGAPPAGHHP